MRIYSRAEFMKLPAGTLFCKGKPWYWDTPSVKGETSKFNDFYARDLTNIEACDSGELFGRLQEMLDKGTSYPLHDIEGRDGCFDDEDLFLVYEHDDLVELARVISNAMDAATQEISR